MPASETTVGPRGSVSSLMAGKRGLVMGVANDHSIAWGVAKTLHEHGAELAFTYQGENFGRRVKPLADSVGAELLLPADVQDESKMLELPALCLLSEPKFEAARVIQKGIKGGGRRKRLSSETPAGAARRSRPSFELAEPLSRELLLMIVDMLPSTRDAHTPR